MNISDRKTAMLWGAFVADAASMGFHWLYDQPRIRQVAPKQPEFRTPTRADFDGVAGYFAHPTRRAGDLSHYGEQALVMLRAVQGADGYARESYQQAFKDYFGYGGSFVGYIDRATRGTLDNLARIEREAGEDTRVQDMPYPGTEDTQLPATSKLPGLIARHLGAADLPQIVEDAVRVTNDNDTSVNFAQAATGVLSTILQTGALPDFEAFLDTTAPEVADAVRPVLSRSSDTTETVTADIGLSCYLKFGLPSVVHNLTTASTFEQAIRSNIYAGGDNCGRAILLGAAMGAIHGVGGKAGVPTEWIDKLTDKAELETLMQTLSA